MVLNRLRFDAPKFEGWIWVPNDVIYLGKQVDSNQQIGFSNHVQGIN